MEIKRVETVKPEDINDLMTTALEGGINYWCNKVEILADPENKPFASEVIAYGGELKIYTDEGAEFKITRDDIVKGIEKAIEHFEYGSFKQLMEEHDATTADVIIQFALFDKIVFG
jgi:hypothetical protein